MKKKLGLGDLVYATGMGSVCSKCEKALESCICKDVYSGDGVVKVRRETKGRKGKGVVTLRDIPLVGSELKDFAKKIKQKCGVGGTIKNGVVEIQGDCLAQVVEFVKSKNMKVKQIGG